MCWYEAQTGSQPVTCDPVSFHPSLRLILALAHTFTCANINTQRHAAYAYVICIFFHVRYLVILCDLDHSSLLPVSMCASLPPSPCYSHLGLLLRILQTNQSAVVVRVHVNMHGSFAFDSLPLKLMFLYLYYARSKSNMEVSPSHLGNAFVQLFWANKISLLYKWMGIGSLQCETLNVHTLNCHLNLNCNYLSVSLN